MIKEVKLFRYRQNCGGYLPLPQGYVHEESVILYDTLLFSCDYFRAARDFVRFPTESDVC